MRAMTPDRGKRAQRNPFAADLMGEQVAIITGGGSGIGLATAHEMLAAGAKVAICGRNADKLRAAFAELDGAGRADADPGGESGARREVFAAPCDIREPEAVAVFVDAVLERFGR